MLQDIEPVGTRSPVPLVTAVVAGMGALAAAQLSVLGQIGVPSVGLGGGPSADLLVYTPLVVLVLALLAWHVSPRRSWPVLVVAGAACTLPNLVLVLLQSRDDFADWMLDPYLVIDSSARPLLLVGLLGGATAVWRAGGRRAGAVLMATTLVVPPLTTFIVAAYLLDIGVAVPVTGLVLVAAAIVATIVAAVTAPPPIEPEPRPEWRVTAAGAVAGVAPVVYRWWQGSGAYEPGTDVDDYLREAGRHALLVGLVVLGIGLAAGIAAGARVLVTGTAAGVLLGAVSTLAGPASLDLHDVPAAVPAVVAAVALAAGIVCALPRFRVMIGVTGLAGLVVGLLVLYEVFTADDPIFDSDVTNVLTPILIAVTVVAVLSVLTSLGMVVTPSGAAPAAFAGVVGAVAAGVVGISGYFSLNPPADTPASLASYPPVMGLLVVAGLLTLFAHRRWQREERD